MLKTLRDRLQLRRGFGLVWLSSKKWSSVVFALTLLVGTLPVLALYLQKIFFDFFTDSLGKTEGFDQVTLMWIIGSMAAVEVALAALRSAGTYATAAQSETVQDSVMSMLHGKSIELDLSFYETPSYFDSLHMAQTEAPRRISAFVQVLSATARDALSLVSVLALLVTYQWWLAALLFIAVGPGLLVHMKSSQKLFKWQRSAASRQRESEYYHGLITQASAAKESRVFQFGSVVATWYRELRERLRNELLSITYWKQMRILVVNACAALTLYFGVYLFARGAVEGNYTIGDMALFYAAFHRCQGHLRGLIGSISGLYESNLFLGNLFDVLDQKAEIVNKPSGAKSLPEGVGSIVFDRVSFSYPGTERQALRNVSLQIEPGEHIAIVGKNGSGKSTFVKLICRLYDCSAGSIRFGGVDIKEYRIDEYRSRYSVLFQDYLQYSLSVRRNIWLGNTRKSEKLGIEEAAQLSGASRVVEGLASGYDTALGKILAKGEQLSQGEWQKVALARALYADADVTILDEPTSWMDPESEQEFFERFHQIARNRTAIMISHRLSTVKMVDRIVVMEGGRILEVGSHEELMQKQGRYFELFETQATSYR